MSLSLFLGLGKSNLGLASVVSGTKLAFVEREDGLLEILEYRSGKFEKIETQQGGFDSFDWNRYAFSQVFVSPGIDPRRPFMKVLSAKERRELDFVRERFQGKILVITGTDGKSTMTVQSGEVLKRAFPQKKIFVGGNLGIPMAELLKGTYDWAVLEVSSFQAERIQSAHFDYGVLLNLAPDHLDRYDSLDDYYAAKWRLISKSQVCYFPGELSRPKFCASVTSAEFSNDEEVSVILRLVMTSLLQKEDVAAQPSFFERLPRLSHRQEIWKDQQGAFFINDSKATTVHATAYALKHLSQKFSRLHWVLGGRYKGDDFSILLPMFRKTDSVYVVGEASSIIMKQLQGRGQVFASLKDCLSRVAGQIRSGEAFVLSPACSSYDEFNNFEERGHFFLKEIERARGVLERVD
jgi:UDP-N-acetylmuramoylalanine--D-glutamate ligase